MTTFTPVTDIVLDGNNTPNHRTDQTDTDEVHNISHHSIVQNLISELNDGRIKKLIVAVENTN